MNKIILFFSLSSSILTASAGSSDPVASSSSSRDAALFIFPTIQRDYVFERLHSEFKKTLEICKQNFFGDAIEMIENYRIIESDYNEKLEKLQYKRNMCLGQEEELISQRNTALIGIVRSINEFKVRHYNQLGKEIKSKLMPLLDELCISNPEILKFYDFLYPRYSPEIITFKEALNLIREDKVSHNQGWAIKRIIEKNIHYFFGLEEFSKKKL